MKIILVLLLLIPSLSWGHDSKYGYSDSEIFCKPNEKVKEWAQANKGNLNKREINNAKCILKHSNKQSNLSSKAIEDACWVLAKDKYPVDPRPLPYIDTLGEEVSAHNCHAH